MLRVWNLSLLIATFSLTILGTFLTRSGVLDSVHAFSESGIGPAIARRLDSAGISTYEKLADSTPAELSGLLAGIGGTPAGRIAESDWIGQARRLTAPRGTGTAPAQVLPSAPSAAPPAEPECRHAIALHRNVLRPEHQPFQHRLRDQQPVEGIAVVTRQPAGASARGESRTFPSASGVCA